MPKKQKILLFKLGAIGDVVFTMPALNAIKSILPDAHITWVTGRSCSPLLQSHALLDDLIIVDDFKFFSKNWTDRIMESLRLREQLKKDQSLVLLGHRALSYTLLLRSKINAPVFQLARYKPNLWKQMLQRAVVINPIWMHESHAMRELVKAGLEHLLYNRLNDMPWIWDFSHVPDSDLDLPSSFIVLHIGGATNVKTEFFLKRWPHFGELIYRLLEGTSHYITLVGNHSDKKETEKVLKESRERFIDSENSQNRTFPEHRLLNWVGKTNLTELISILRKANFFVGADSGPLHIADSLNIPSIGLYGPTSLVSWGLLGHKSTVLHENIECSPCYKDDGFFPECPFEHKCMKNLNVEVVLKEILNR